MPTADSLKRYSASSFSSWMGNCSALQFSSKSEVHTKWIVPRQALSHLCISQGVSLVQDVQACSLFSLSWPWWASPTPISIHLQLWLPRENAEISNPGKQILGRLFPSLQTPPHWDRPLLRAPSWQKRGPNCLLLLSSSVRLRIVTQPGEAKLRSVHQTAGIYWALSVCPFQAEPSVDVTEGKPSFGLPGSHHVYSGLSRHEENCWCGGLGLTKFKMLEEK